MKLNKDNIDCIFVGRDVCILTILEKMREEMRQIHHKLNLVLSRQDAAGGHDRDVHLPEGIELPWATMDMADRTEAMLQNSDLI